MEGVSARVYKGLKGYWGRRGYQRLNTSSGRRRQNQVQLASDGSNRRRRFWRIKINRKLKIKLNFSPKKFCIGLRDAYVRMMMRLASSGMMISSGGAGGGFAGNGIGGFGARPMKEYDERMIIEVYKSILMAQGQLVPRDACKIRTDIICGR
ncbi:hypothetical protein LguiB_030426 [Lonicera macranthoides]